MQGDKRYCSTISGFQRLIVDLNSNISNNDQESHNKTNNKSNNTLPVDKAREISDFAGFIMKQYEEHLLTKGIQKLMEEDQVLTF